MGNAGHFARKTGALSALIMLAAWAPGLAVAAQCPPPTQLRSGPVDRAFVQDRFLAGVERPLRSQGRLTVDDKATVWHMLTPFDVRTTIDASGISQSVDGEPSSPMGAGAAQIGAQVARATAAMLQGQWSALEGIFAVDIAHPDAAAAWTVTLKPHDRQLASVLSSIKVVGCTDVTLIVVDHPGGDREEISFESGGAK